MSSVNIAVIGAGPTGLVAALLSRFQGLHVEVFDQKSQSDVFGHAHFLNAYSLHILSVVGVDMDALLSLSTPVSQSLRMAYGFSFREIYAYADLNSDAFFKKAWDSAGPWGGSRSICYHSLMVLLLDCCQRYGVPIHWDTRIDSLLQLDSHVELLLCSIVKKRRYTQSFSWVFNCEGSQGHLAKKLGQAYMHKKDWRSFISVDVYGDISDFCQLPCMLYWFYQPDFQCCVVAHDCKKYQVWQIPIHKVSRNMDATVINTVAKSCVSHILGDHGMDTFTLGNAQVWRMQTHLLKSMRKDRVFFLGDCVHAMTPAGGMGMNAGFADAYNLVWKLAAYLDKPKSYTLQSYHDERYPIVRQQVQYSINNYQDFLSLPRLFGVDAPGISITSRYTRFPSSLSSYQRTLSRMLPMVFNMPLLGRFLRESIDSVVAKNALHFQGLDQHLGFMCKEFVITRGEKSTASYTFVNDCYLPGRILPFVQLSGNRLGSLYDYIDGKTWLCVVENNQSHWYRFFKGFTNCMVVVQGIHFDPRDKRFILPLGFCLVVRPDAIVSALLDDVDETNSKELFTLWLNHDGDDVHVGKDLG